VAVDGAGAVYVAWLDKRKGTPERPGFSRAYFARSVDGGRSFTHNTDVSAGQDAPICHCCRVAIAVHERRGLFIAFRNDVDDLRDIFLVHSEDRGTTFTGPAPIEDTQWRVPT
jgi:hypothetical protein